jgi:hypothetical protein
VHLLLRFSAVQRPSAVGLFAFHLQLVAHVFAHRSISNRPYGGKVVDRTSTPADMVHIEIVGILPISVTSRRAWRRVRLGYGTESLAAKTGLDLASSNGWVSAVPERRSLSFRSPFSTAKVLLRLMGTSSGSQSRHGWNRHGMYGRWGMNRARATLYGRVENCS